MLTVIDLAMYNATFAAVRLGGIQSSNSPNADDASNDDNGAVPTSHPTRRGTPGGSRRTLKANGKDSMRTTATDEEEASAKALMGTEAWRSSAYSFCGSYERNCALLVISTYDAFDITINELFLSLTDLHCSDSFSLADSAWYVLVKLNCNNMVFDDARPNMIITQWQVVMHI
jgi:hypothetical protein